MAMKQSNVISQNSRFKLLLLTGYCLLFTVLIGCASLKTEEELVLAVVDSEPVTEEDLRYSLTITHRREELSTAGSLNLFQYVQKMVDDRIIINEARIAGMDRLPEIQQALQAYILRESVVRLHDGEVVKKVSVTEEEVKENYRRNYESFTIGYIEVQSEEKAKEVIVKLNKNEDFKQIAMAYSLQTSKEKGGEMTILRGSLIPPFEDAISSLNPGEVSGVISNKGKYFIVKLIQRKEASEEEFSKFKKGIEKEIRKRKEKEWSDEYLKYLREKMNVKINRELLSKIQVDSKKQEIDSFLKDTKPLVEVNGGTLTVGEFIKLTVSSPGKSADDILNNWIDRKLIDIEALSRHYEKGKDLRELIRRYENQILKNTFIKRVIVPQITVTDEDLKEYYTKNQAEFLKPSQYKIQQIKVKTIEEAREIENSLRNGADFSWIAKRKSIDSATSKGGNAVWVTKKELAEPLINIIDTLSIGEISPVTQVDSHYSIIKIQDKKVEEIEKFEKVKNAVYTATFNKNLKEIIEKYVNQLKQDVKIRIYEDAISSLEEQLQE